MFKLILKISK